MAGIRLEIAILVLVAVLLPVLAGAAALSRLDAAVEQTSRTNARILAEEAQDFADARVAAALDETEKAAGLPASRAVEEAGGPAWYVRDGRVVARGAGAAPAGDGAATEAAVSRKAAVLGAGGVLVAAAAPDGVLVRWVSEADALRGAAPSARLAPEPPPDSAAAPLATGAGYAAVPTGPSSLSAWRVAGASLLAFSLAGGVVVAVALHERIVRPLRNLEGAARRMAAGERTSPVQPSGSDEIVSLATAFLAMAEEIERDKAALAERAERLEVDVGDLEFATAHDFREPLRSIGTIASQLLESPIDADTRRGVELVRDTAAHLERVSSDVGRLLDANRRALDVRAVEALAAFEGALEGLGVPAGARVSFEGGGLLRADAAAAADLLRELLANGLAFNRSGAPSVVVRASPSGSRVEIQVEDNGVGIPPAQRSRVFAPFHRLRPREFPGSGIGLAIVKRLAERHGAEIEIGDSPLGGTLVRLDWPAA